MGTRREKAADPDAKKIEARSSCCCENIVPVHKDLGGAESKSKTGVFVVFSFSVFAFPLARTGNGAKQKRAGRGRGRQKPGTN